MASYYKRLILNFWKVVGDRELTVGEMDSVDELYALYHDACEEEGIEPEDL